MTEQERVCSFPTVNARPCEARTIREKGPTGGAAVHVVALVKQIPNPQSSPELGPDHLLVRAGADGALDPGDEYGLELGLRLAEAHGGEVTVLSMGPEEAASAVQRALAMGAAGGILVTDPALRGADALATARVLAAVIGRGPVDLVVAGAESTDGYTGTVPLTIAELLGMPSVTAVRSLEVVDGQIHVERQTETGTDLVSCPLPALVTVTAGATDPRYPSLKGIMGAKQKPLERLSLADLGISPDAVAATQRVVSVADAAPKAGGEVIDDTDAVERVVELLTEAKAI
jgi:electron transfer flavoprotein beta subunit